MLLERCPACSDRFGGGLYIDARGAEAARAARCGCE